MIKLQQNMMISMKKNQMNRKRKNTIKEHSHPHLHFLTFGLEKLLQIEVKDLQRKTQGNLFWVGYRSFL